MQQTILMKRQDPNNDTKFIDEWFKVYLSSREEIQSEFIQKHLKKRNLQQRTIKCGCKPNENLYLSSNKSNDNYYLKRYPTNREHEIECIFYSEVSNYIDYTEQGKAIYKPTIFEEPKINMNDDELRPAIESDIKRYTYYAFCQEIISNACIYAFYYTNKERERGSLINFTYKNFISSLINGIKKTPISGVNNLYDLCNNKDNGLRYSFGVIDQDIRALLAGAANNEENSIMEVPYDENRILKTTKRRLEIAAQRLRIFNNFIHPQYFFIAVLNYGIAIRLYLYPIYYDQDNICFVESDYERQYAAQLFTKNITFIKPINNLEFQFIPKEKICSAAENKFRLSSRPDFIELDTNKVSLVEVSGYDTEQYQEQLRDKEKDYKDIIEKFNYVNYKRIDGITKEVIYSF
jgi:hypothetical protein